jgi:NAD(P)H-dependent flavin oxidoreductase YrpB (nitropropane dioxygenase family)
VVDDSGDPVYGPRDDANLEKMAELGVPFWLAGSYGTPERLADALTAGAAGIQAGSIFALSDESGLTDDLRGRARTAIAAETLAVHTHVTASPTGFPFKVADVPGLTDSLHETHRERLCDIGVLRTLYVRPNGRLGYRCPAEPVDVFIGKGGTREQTENVACLCNGLIANVGLAQHRPDGYVEPPLLTLGSDLEGPRRLLASHPLGWSASEAIDWLLGGGELGADTPAQVQQLTCSG